jgi:enamine deaminase RidA (YjgF/YER057c/UK114 family)
MVAASPRQHRRRFGRRKLHDKGKIEAAPAAGNRSGHINRQIDGCLRTGPRSAKTLPPLEEELMAGMAEKALATLGITLPSPASPVANYVACVRSGNLLVVSGQLCFGGEGKLIAKGQLGGAVSIEDGQKAAQACAVNLLAQIKAVLGDLDQVTRVVRLGGFINSAPGFTDGPKVMNGASDLMVEVFGDKGRHARTTVGVSALPADAAVEVEGMFEVA